MSDAPAYYFNAQILTIGIGFFTFIHFLIVAVTPGSKRMYGYFALTCLAMSLSAVFTALSVHAESVESIMSILHWRAAFIILTPSLMIRVIAEYTGKPVSGFISYPTDLVAVLFEIFNWLLPESIFFSTTTTLKSLLLPWGEILNQAKAKAGPFLYLTWAMTIIDVAWAYWRSIALYRSGRRWLAAILGFSITFTLGALSIRLLTYIFTGVLIPPFTELCIFGLIIPISIALGVQMQKQALNLSDTISLLQLEIAHREETKKQLWQLAYMDNLTGLPNRQHFISQLQKSLAFNEATPEFASVILVDLDRFTLINDTLGHDVGDDVLKTIAVRLQDNCIIEQAFVARMFGDEFAVLLFPLVNDIGQAGNCATALAKKIHNSLKKPLLCGEHKLFVEVTLGIASLSEANGDWCNVMRQADMALHAAKSAGKHIQSFAPDMQSRLDELHTISNNLRQAVSKQQLLLYFQPLLTTNKHCQGAEVLLRWLHPELGLISPDIFIPIAEETGLINEIGDWVLNTTCSQLLSWEAGGHVFSGHLSLNISPWQFNRPDFVEHLHSIISTYGVSPGKFVIEITESALLSDLETAKSNLLKLQELGFQVSLDDFGTGYSSLSYLRNLAFDELKIDKSFVSVLKSNCTDPLVESIIHIGKQLGMRLVAEGVESEEQRISLTQMGFAGLLQGYLFSRPLSEADFLVWLAGQELLNSLSLKNTSHEIDP